jgi:hypothetical protein
VSSDGILLDVQACSVEVIAVLNGDPSISPLVDGALPYQAFRSAPSLGMNASDPAHIPNDLVIPLGPHEQVPVVGHDAIFEKPDGARLLRLNQHLEEESIVSRRVE